MKLTYDLFSIDLYENKIYYFDYLIATFECNTPIAEIYSFIALYERKVYFNADKIEKCDLECLSSIRFLNYVIFEREVIPVDER